VLKKKRRDIIYTDGRGHTRGRGEENLLWERREEKAIPNHLKGRGKPMHIYAGGLGRGSKKGEDVGLPFPIIGEPSAWYTRFNQKRKVYWKGRGESE